jgi:bifunctional non-homologous end joining protein LigD
MKENRLDGLYLGRQDGDELTYAGKVDHGFSSDLAPKFYPAVSSLLAFGLPCLAGRPTAGFGAPPSRASGRICRRMWS